MIVVHDAQASCLEQHRDRIMIKDILLLKGTPAQRCSNGWVPLLGPSPIADIYQHRMLQRPLQVED